MTDSERENDATLTVSEDGAAAGDARNEREISSDDVPPKPVELYDETSIVHCFTTAGPFVLELYRGWAPRGYDKASTLFQAHAFDDTHFFRCLPGFLVQFGIPYTSSATLSGTLPWRRFLMILNSNLPFSSRKEPSLSLGRVKIRGRRKCSSR